MVDDTSEALLAFYVVTLPAFYVVTLPGLSLQPFPLGILFRGLVSKDPNLTAASFI